MRFAIHHAQHLCKQSDMQCSDFSFSRWSLGLRCLIAPTGCHHRCILVRHKGCPSFAILFQSTKIFTTLFHSNEFRTKTGTFHAPLFFRGPVYQGTIEINEKASARATSNCIPRMVSINFGPPHKTLSSWNRHIGWVFTFAVI